MLILIAGSGATKADVAACLAKASATSFPGMLLWPGTYSSLTLLKTDNFFSADSVSVTRLDVVLADWRAFSAAWLSEHIAIDASFSDCKELAQVRIAYTSAFPCDDLHENFRGCQWMAKVPNGVGKLLKISTG